MWIVSKQNLALWISYYICPCALANSLNYGTFCLLNNKFIYCIAYRYLYSASHGVHVCQTDALSVNFSSRKKVYVLRRVYRTRKLADIDNDNDRLMIIMIMMMSESMMDDYITAMFMVIVVSYSAKVQLLFIHSTDGVRSSIFSATYMYKFQTCSKNKQAKTRREVIPKWWTNRSK